MNTKRNHNRLLGIIVLLIVFLSLSTTIQVSAKGGGSSSSSSSSSSSKSSFSSSSVKSSTSSTSSPKTSSSSTGSTSSKSSFSTGGASGFKSGNFKSSSVDKSSSSFTSAKSAGTSSTYKSDWKSSSPYSSTNKPASSYKVAPRYTSPTNTPVVVYHYYDYSPSSYYPSWLNIWYMYHLEDMMGESKEDLTEQDIAKALEDKGYSEDEIKSILDDAKQEKADAIENTNDDAGTGFDSPVFTWFIIIMVCIVGGVIVWFIWEVYKN